MKKDKKLLIVCLIYCFTSIVNSFLTTLFIGKSPGGVLPVLSVCSFAID